MDKKKINVWIPVLIWAGFIFALSEISVLPSTNIRWQEFVVKKSAHVFEYFVLTTLLYRAIKESGKKKTLSGKIAVVLSVLYAVSDEFHQSFTPGRTPTVRDVGFDTIGALLAIYAVWMLLPKAPPKLKALAKRLRLIS